MLLRNDAGEVEWARCLQRLSNELALDQGRVPRVDATRWFIGPKGEHEHMLRALIAEAIDSHIAARRAYAPEDPRFDTADEGPAGVLSATQLEMRDELGRALQRLLHLLQGSVPLASYRNQSHMYWDITLPGIVGYFAGMLYNQNNVAAEASPITTVLELQVGKDLCAMLGYRHPDPERPGSAAPWGHITCDGSVANGEAMWAARNLKFLPIALAAAIRTERQMWEARNVVATSWQGKCARLVDFSTWELLNLPIDEVIALPERIASETKVDEATVRRAIDACSLQAIGMAALQMQYLDSPAHAHAVVMAPGTAHYSWPKTAALLGLGARNVHAVRVDLDGRMCMKHLREQLDTCLEMQWPVLQVVAVVGTTSEGAADPLADILQMREEFRRRGLEFVVHVDGAWGGYFASMLREVDEPPHDRACSIDDHPELQLSAHVRQQLRSFWRADTVTLDPHKSGFIPYPAGGLCYRNGDMRLLIAHTAPVVYHDGRDVTVGMYGIEGSKPGAAAASVYLSHAMVPLNRKGYGRLLGRCVFNSKRFYAALVCMPQPEDVFTVTALQRLPSERHAERASPEELDFLRREIVERADNDALFEFLALADRRADAQRALQLFQAIGSDLSIVAYAFNFKTAHGVNRDLDLMNELNRRLFEAMSLHPAQVERGGVPEVDMIVTASEFSTQQHGEAFVRQFAHRAGVRYREAPIRFLISTAQNPWLTATREGSFIGTLMQILRAHADRVARELMSEHGLAAPHPDRTRAVE